MEVIESKIIEMEDVSRFICTSNDYDLRRKNRMQHSGGENTRVELIDVDLITENPFQPRKTFVDAEIDELSTSILTHGLIQPVILRHVGAGYQVVAGERRLRATRKAGLRTIPSIIVSLDGVDVAEVSLIENIQRKNLNCIEEAEAFLILKSKFGLSAEDIAKRIGKSRPYVSNLIRLTVLPQKVKDALMSGVVSMGHGRALLALATEGDQLQTLETIIRESLVTRIIGGDEPPQAIKKKKLITDSLFGDSLDYYNSLQEVVREIKKSGGRADVIERETDDYYEIVVRLSK